MAEQKEQPGYCFTCGTETDLTRHFCRACGGGFDTIPVANRTKFCITCGSGLAGNWKHCIVCGTEASEASATEHYEKQAISKRPTIPPPPPDTPGVELISRGWSDEETAPSGPVSPPPPAPVPTTSGPIPAGGIPTTQPAEIIDVRTPDSVDPDQPASDQPVTPFESPAFKQSTQEDGTTDQSLQPTLRPHAFVDPGLASHITQLAFLITTSLVVVRLVGLDRFGDAAPDSSLYDRTTVPLIAIGALSVVALLWWSWTTAGNFEALGRPGLRRGRTFAIWAWLVPIAQVPLSRHLINRMWKAPEPDSWSRTPWSQRQGNTAITVAWLTLILALLLLGAPLVSATLGNLASTSNRFLQAAGLLSLATSLLGFVRSVGGVTDRHQQRIEGTLR